MENGTFSNNPAGGHDPKKFKEACERAVEAIRKEAIERKKQLEDPNSIQSLLKRLRGLVDRKYGCGPINWQPFQPEEEDINDFKKDAWRYWGHLWRMDCKFPRSHHINMGEASEDEFEPEDWIDMFAKHIEIEMMLDQ